MDFWTKAARMCASVEISARGRSNPDVRPHVGWTGSTLPGRCVETHWELPTFRGELLLGGVDCSYRRTTDDKMIGEMQRWAEVQ